MTSLHRLAARVNVGGTGKLPMADLKAMLAALGFGDARTLLRRGNVVFEAAGAARPCWKAARSRDRQMLWARD